ncbi:DUF1801 domain-containing protein [Corticicoccus populi]|uniref:DUF1801 domain-containing protein n=1 Tax=Corticicoccus populi TaxID=1812821 RepID=A0ABW5WT41_9STAP
MTFDEYVETLDPKWKESFLKLWHTVEERIPDDFEIDVQHGMPGFVVPKTIYPDGYHVDNEPLPFMGIASQKRHLAVYHMGIYRDPDLYNWFTGEYPKHMTTKLNMGKSCIRFTNPNKVPYELIGDLAGKMSAEEWIQLYESKR